MESQVQKPVSQGAGMRPVMKSALAGILTAVETIATMMLAITIPGSDGYFNVGEGIIYITAILFGPFIGAFVGGVGAALADILLGYAAFAPGTLIIKGAEGFIVGTTFKLLTKSQILQTYWKGCTLGLGTIVGGLMIAFGWGNLIFIILGLILIAIIWIIGLVVNRETVFRVFAMINGGCVMVVGYFLYELWFLQIGAEAAAFEVPFNCLQVLLGILIAIPVITAIQPFLKNVLPE